MRTSSGRRRPDGRRQNVVTQPAAGAMGEVQTTRSSGMLVLLPAAPVPGAVAWGSCRPLAATVAVPCVTSCSASYGQGVSVDCGSPP